MRLCTILSYMQCSTIIVGVVIIIIVSKGWARRAFNDYCTSVYIICIVLSFECCKTKGGDGGGEGGQMKLYCHRADPFGFGIVRSCFYISKHLLTHTYTHKYRGRQRTSSYIYINSVQSILSLCSVRNPRPLANRTKFLRYYRHEPMIRNVYLHTNFIE